MTDDLDRLKTALRAAPAPEPDAKARALALAMENFDRHQESAARSRPNSDRPSTAGVLTGVRAMLSSLTSRPAFAATTSVAALCVGLLVVIPAIERDSGALLPPSAPPEVVIDEAVADRTAAQDQPAVQGAEASALAAPEAEPPAAPKTAAATETQQPGAASGISEADGSGADAVRRAEGEVGADLRDQDAVGGVAGALESRTAEETARTQPSAAAKAAAPAPAEMAESVDTLAPDRMRIGMTTTTPSPLDKSLKRLSEGTYRSGDEAGPALLAPPADALVAPEPDTEAFANEAPSPIRQVATDPVSTFSIDVDTASYGLVRSSLMSGYLPPPEAVRIEEMVNYFPYGYAGPEADEAPFRPTVSVVPAPWNAGKRLVHIGIQGRLPALDDRPPLNLVFLIDTSGSMQDADKLPLLKRSFQLMLGQLRPEDQVAIVTYAGSAGEVLEPTPASDAGKIMAALSRLDAGGSTAGQAGLQQAYQVAEAMAADGEVTRVILATDGDFNVGISDPDQLKTFIEGRRRSGTYLSVLGFGRGNVDDAVMQALAQNGNGTAAYIDTLSEAQKVLVDQLSGALFPIANDVKIQMEFNPAVIAEYRLIGYETRALAREDFSNDRVDAGDIGAGHSVTAIYEVTPVGSPAVQIDPLRYSAADAALEPAAETAELGYLKLRYKEPGATVSQLIEIPVAPEPGQPDEATRFAIAMAGFGQLLSGATYLGDWGWDEAIALAIGARGEDPFGYRAEAVQLMRLAQSLSH